MFFEQGVLGTLIYYFFLGYLLFVAFKRRKDRELFFCGVVLVGVEVALLFGYLTIVSSAFWWFFAALIVAKGENKANLRLGLWTLPLVATVGFMVFFSVFSLHANSQYQKGVVALMEDKKFEALSFFKEAVVFDPTQQFYSLNGGKYALELYASGELGNLMPTLWFLERAEKNGKTIEYKLLEGERFGFDEQFEKAENSFDEVILLAKNNPEWWLRIGDFYKAFGVNSKAEVAYGKYLGLIPELDAEEWRLFLKDNPEYLRMAEWIEGLKGLKNFPLTEGKKEG
ncbi:MAG: hypothetical protein U1C56_02045 [Candidatus Curtissbacteria bacterium]|nr:hypothetical protein [Candidatus Curtissbacteria bacterium]